LKKTLLFRDHGVGCHGNHRDTGESRLLPHPCSQGESVLITKLNIKQHRVGLPLLERAKDGLQIFRIQDFMAFRFQPVTQQLTIQRVVFDDEYAVLYTFSGIVRVITRCICFTSAFCQGSCL
jgi:hypothetical protein